MSSTTATIDQNIDPEINTSIAQAQHKRARVQLSCTSCRHAKLRCDRGHPCNQCTKRNRSSLCAYTTVPARQKQPKSLQSRLNHLETLVIGMMNEQPLKNMSSPSSSTRFSSSEASLMQENQPMQCPKPLNLPVEITPEHNNEQNPLGEEVASSQVVLSTNETAYVGATHWAAILEDIEEIRGYFIEVPEEEFDPTNEGPTATMVLDSITPTSRAGLIAALPERSVVDRLVSRYFNSNDPAMIIIHKPTFQKEYQEFWSDPSTKPTIWIGLLYAMLCLATFYCLRAGDERLEQAVDSANRYRTLCAQSLVLGNYFKPGLYTMEALILYLESEFALPGDNTAKCWILHGMAVRLALRMGYHRDAKYHVNISAFHGEMRRRMWHLLVQVDLILSFQVGLPSMIISIQSDTAPPHNLFDDDFYQDSPELPPGRPDSEPTPMSYMICKARLCDAFGTIVDQANSISNPTYSEVLDLDARLHKANSLIPPFLLIRQLDQSVTDNPNLIMQRFNIILLFHKSRCVLHRKYLLKDGSKSQFTYSRTSCIDSALELLKYQSIINNAVQPSGPLSRDRWFLTTIAAHDFLLGAMIIYLTLLSCSEARTIEGGPGYDMVQEMNQEVGMFRQLELSYETWKLSPREVIDARKAAGVLEIMLKNPKLRLFRDYGGMMASTYEPEQNIEKPWFSTPFNATVGYLGYDQAGPVPPGQMEELGSMIAMPDMLNWETWDDHINAPATPNNETFWASDVDFDEFVHGNSAVTIDQL